MEVIKEKFEVVGVLVEAVVKKLVVDQVMDEKVDKKAEEDMQVMSEVVLGDEMMEVDKDVNGEGDAGWGVLSGQFDKGGGGGVKQEGGLEGRQGGG